MKKVIVITFLTVAVFGQAQSYPKNEVKFNILNTMIIGSVEVGYERFIAENQSVDGELLINDRVNYNSQKDNGTFKTNALKIGYNYYFGDAMDRAGSGVYANPFVKFRFGDYEKNIKENDIKNKVDIDMSAFILGFGVGYKWNNNDKFTMGPYANIGRNFSDKSSDEFSSFEYNLGFSVGYRF